MRGTKTLSVLLDPILYSVISLYTSLRGHDLILGTRVLFENVYISWCFAYLGSLGYSIVTRDYYNNSTTGDYLNISSIDVAELSYLLSRQYITSYFLLCFKINSTQRKKLLAKVKSKIYRERERARREAMAVE